MKYAENNRISHRQLYHQIILSFLAPLLICIPGYNGEQGMSGTVGIMAAVLILLLYVFFLIRTSYCYADPVKIMGKLKGSLLGIIFFNDTATTEIYTSLFVGSVRVYKRQVHGKASLLCFFLPYSSSMLLSMATVYPALARRTTNKLCLLYKI